MADDSAKHLYDVMIAHGGAGLPKETGQIATVVDQSSYDLNARVYRLTAIWVPVSGANAFVDIRSFQDRDVADLLTESANGPTLPQSTRYQLRTPSNGATAAPPVVDLLPIPKQVFVVGYRYVPTPLTIGAGGATYYEVGNGWDEWIIWDCVAQVCEKMKEDPSFAISQREKSEARVMAAATERDANEPDMYVDFQRGLRDVATGFRRGRSRDRRGGDW